MQNNSVNKSITVFIVSTQVEKDEFIAQTLIQNGLSVIISDSLEEVYFDIVSNKPKLILIRDKISSANDILINKIKQKIPHCIIRNFNSFEELINPVPEFKNLTTLSRANLHLVTVTLAKAVGITSSDTAQIGTLVDRLCRQLQLSSHDYLKTVTAGYLQDISNLYFRGNTPSDRETAFFKLLSLIEDNIIYPPSILNIIRRMYQDLSNLSSTELVNSDLRNSNIVTIVDFYYKYFSTNEKLTPYRFDSIKEHLQAQKNIILIPDVVDSFLIMLKEDIIYQNSKGASGYSLVLNKLNNDLNSLSEILKSCGFESIHVDTQEKLIKSFHQQKPNVLIIDTIETIEQVREDLEFMISKGIIFSSVPTILLHTSDDHEKACSMLKFGLYDVIKFSGSYDILKIRLKRIQAEQEHESRLRLNILQEMGTHGSLSHMNVIDLLQAMGSSNKLLSININNHENNLTMYLSNGVLLFAECNDKKGVEAVYEALGWHNGIWSVEHIAQSELPEPNVNRSIDSILIEGCYLLDEFNNKKNKVNEKTESSIFS